MLSETNLIRYVKVKPSEENNTDELIVFTRRHHFLKSKPKRATKVFILIRHVRRYR